VPRLCEFILGICLKTEEKARKNLSQGSRRVLVYILHITKTPTQLPYPHIHTPTILQYPHIHTNPHITKPTHTHTHTSQNYTKHHSTNQNKPNTRYTQLLQSQYNQVLAVWSHPNVHSTFIHMNFTVTHLISCHFTDKRSTENQQHAFYAQ
jgi:hypothetical protein